MSFLSLPQVQQSSEHEFLSRCSEEWGDEVRQATEELLLAVPTVTAAEVKREWQRKEAATLGSKLVDSFIHRQQPSLFEAPLQLGRHEVEDERLLLFSLLQHLTSSPHPYPLSPRADLWGWEAELFVPLQDGANFPFTTSAFQGRCYHRYSKRLITAYLLATQGWEWTREVRCFLQSLPLESLLLYPQWVCLLQGAEFQEEWRHLPPAWWLPLAKEAYHFTLQ